MIEYIPSESIRAWARANGYDPELHIDFFNDYLANKQGKPYRDIDAAFRNCCRCDWGGLRRNKQKVTNHVAPCDVKRVNTAVPLPPRENCVPNPRKGVL